MAGEVWTLDSGDGYSHREPTMYPDRETAWPDLEAAARELHQKDGIRSVRENDFGEVEVDAVGSDVAHLHVHQIQDRALTRRTPEEERDDLEAGNQAVEWREVEPGSLFNFPDEPGGSW